MKTTVDISESLFREAKQYAARHGIPLREVFERGLQIVLKDAPRSGRRFRLKTVTTKGEGMAVDADWSTIRSMIYEGHGG
ncbi:MAG: hypothetical protein HY238_24775 [Acidobacteria bacterium]|nr:hypothetical protein [Acidobacteriota bacterium]